MRTNNLGWLPAILCTAACGGFGVESSATDAPRTVQTSKGTFTLPSPALADGRGLDGRPINVWNGLARTKANCQVPDGEPMVLVRAQHHAEEKRYYFEIIAMNKCEGWLPEAFVRPDPDVRK